MRGLSRMVLTIVRSKGLIFVAWVTGVCGKPQVFPQRPATLTYIQSVLKKCNTYFTSVVPTTLLLQCNWQARIKEVHSKLHSFQASLCRLTATHLTLIYVCTYIRLSVPLGCLIKQAGIIIHTILNMWETPGIEPVTSDLTSVYQISSSTN